MSADPAGANPMIQKNIMLRDARDVESNIFLDRRDIF
jgi:hypothetical protein